jgi:hypothetical protein
MLWHSQLWPVPFDFIQPEIIRLKIRSLHYILYTFALAPRTHRKREVAAVQQSCMHTLDGRFYSNHRERSSQQAHMHMAKEGVGAYLHAACSPRYMSNLSGTLTAIGVIFNQSLLIPNISWLSLLPFYVSCSPRHQIPWFFKAQT